MAVGWQRARSLNPEGVVRRHHGDRLIPVFTIILMFIGLLVIYAIGPQRANLLNSVYGSQYSDMYFFIKQFISFVVALGGFVAMTLIPYTFIIKHAKKILLTGFLACGILAIFGWSGVIDPTNGAVRWFDLGPFGSIQPAEILKFGILTYLAVFLGVRMKQGVINDFKKTLIPVALVTVAAMLFVIVIQKDLGTGVALTSIILIMLIAAGLNKKIIISLVGLLVIAGIILIFTSPHRVERITTYLQGDNAATDDPDAYHIRHAKIAIGSGGFWGVGIGNSVQASGYVPEAINDSIFAIIGETFGFIGTLSLIVLFVALLMRLLALLDYLVDYRLKLMAAGVFGWLGAHVILNIAAMIGVFPLTGITLPLLSYGGTSMVFMTAALGLMFQLSRFTTHPSRIKENKDENFSSRRGVGRSRHTSYSGS